MTIRTRRNGTLDVSAQDIKPSVADVWEDKTVTLGLDYSAGDSLFVRISSDATGGTNNEIRRFRIVCLGARNMGGRGLMSAFSARPFPAFGSGTIGTINDTADSRSFVRHLGTGAAQEARFRCSSVVPRDWRAWKTPAIKFRTIRFGATNSLVATVYDSDAVADPSCNALNIRPALDSTFEDFTANLTGTYRAGDTIAVEFVSNCDNAEENNHRVEFLDYAR